MRLRETAICQGQAGPVVGAGLVGERVALGDGCCAMLQVQHGRRDVSGMQVQDGRPLTRRTVILPPSLAIFHELCNRAPKNDKGTLFTVSIPTFEEGEILQRRYGQRLIRFSTRVYV